MRELPVGTVTFLFTDIEGSTVLLQQLGEAYAGVLADQRRLLRAAFQAHGGHEVDHEGDAFFVAFERADDAAAAALAAQRALHSHSWPAGAAVQVRMGIHTGEPTLTSGGYIGIDVHRAARLCAVGHGGQVLVSDITKVLIESDLPPGAWLSDLGLHRLKDLAHPTHIFQLTAEGLPATFPPLNSLSVLQHNLPVQLTTFVGREHEIADVKRLLAEGRLVTLTGVGGCGKTRLALQAAADELSAFPHGVWLTDLAGLADPALVSQTVAGALRVHERPGRQIKDVLVDYLAARRILLILDNCEHVSVACALLADGLLRACPDVHVLATSREPLSVPGEIVYQVPPLTSPDPDVHMDPRELMKFEAVRLFVERAGLVRPGFMLTPRIAPAVISICAHLDGIPLAIELAAARVRALPVEQIAQGLHDRFHLLVSSSRTVLPRHQTLKAALGWSYSLLSAEERLLFRRLSIFAGGWSVDAARAVVQGDGISEENVPDFLYELVNKSLVIAEEAGGEARYRLLETVRQYAHDRLTESDDPQPLRDRHARWFLKIAEASAGSDVVHPARGEWLQQLELELENFRAALEWSSSAADTDTALRLSASVWRFWHARGFWHEGRRWIERALARVDDVPTAARAQLLLGMGWLMRDQDEYGTARTYTEQALEYYRQLADARGMAMALFNLGMIVQSQSDDHRAAAFYDECLGLWKELQDEGGVASTLLAMASLALMQGDCASAAEMGDESRRRFDDQENMGGLASTLILLAEVAQVQKEHLRAAAVGEEALSLARRAGDKDSIAAALTVTAGAKAALGDHEGARVLLEESLSLRRELGDRAGVAASLEGLGTVAALQGTLEEAARLIGAAETLREAIGARLQPTGQADHARQVQDLRRQMGEAAFVAAWNAGRAMTLKQRFVRT